MIFEGDCLVLLEVDGEVGHIFVPLSFILFEQSLEKPINKHGIVVLFQRQNFPSTRIPLEMPELRPLSPLAELVKIGRPPLRQLKFWLNRRVICRHVRSS